jgi:hypothetical protein
MSAEPLDDDYDDWPDESAEDCYDCGGDGLVHDCGEDTCCCARPDIDDLVECSTCGGSGVL